MNQRDFQENESLRKSIKKCPICGEQLPPISKVCPSCGQIIEDEGDGTDVNTVMSEIEKTCGSYSNQAIKFYDYILLLIPVVYLIWVVVVLVKIGKSNTKYNEFLVLKSQAQTSYGDHPKFRTYLGSKNIEMERMKGKNKISHAIIYVLIVLDAILLVFSLMSI